MKIPQFSMSSIIILSDSHGYGKNVATIIDRMKKAGEDPKEIIFLGDGIREFLRNVPDTIKVYAVNGNCDGGFYGGYENFDNGGEIIPDERIEFFCGKKLLLMHGHKYFVKDSPDSAIERAVSIGADVLLFGHTHIPFEKTLPIGFIVNGKPLDKPLHIFNPGALSSGSFGVLTVSKSNILLSHGSLL